MTALKAMLRTTDVQAAAGFAGGALVYLAYVLWTQSRGSL